MTIFSRRAIQRLLDENSTWMKAQHLREHVRALNDPDRDTLATVWEIVVLSALRKIGTVEYEPSNSEGSHPDIFFRLSAQSVPIIADIRTVSDKDLHARNPAERLVAEFQKRLSRIGRGGFHLKIGHHARKQTRRGEEAPRVKIPAVNRFREVIFNQRFVEFRRLITQFPDRRQTFVVRAEECDLELTYEPEGDGFSYSHVVYTAASTITNNPVWRALQRKADQLKKARIDGVRGIVICDGGCDLLSRRQGDWNRYGLDDIVKDFLRQRRSVSFVLVLRTAYSSNAPNLNPRYLSIQSHLYKRKLESVPDSVTAFSQIHNLMPQPMDSAINARNYLDWLRQQRKWNVGPTFCGGMHVSNSIKISARSLLELLAGTLSREQFDEEHGLSQHNPFAVRHSQGKLIQSMRIEADALPERDDDWLVFEFRDGDPAVNPFTAKSPS